MAKTRQTPKVSRSNIKPSPQEGTSRLGSKYDKILKENFDKSLRTIIEDVGGLQIIKAEPLQTKMQHTKEYDPDILSHVWLRDGTQKILHAELHLKDEYAINCRLCEYYIMFKRKKKALETIQFVIYLGSEDPKYITGLWETESLHFRYNVIILKNIPYDTFLEADNAETVVLSILAHFQGDPSETVSKKIADRIKELSKTNIEKEKYFTQLRVLSNVRKLQPIIDTIMTNIYKLIDISEDPLYVEGKVEGKLEGKLEGKVEGKLEGKLEGKIESIESLIIKTNFDDESIANLLDVPLDLVKKTRQNLKKH